MSYDKDMTSPAVSEVRAALTRMNQGESSADILATLVAAAESYAAMETEYGFASPMPGLTYSTRNDMLVETMKAGRPGAPILVRIAPEWVSTEEGR